ncbi:Tat pathway signal sequence domain protein [Inquilinus sp. OTU3971]|uniref:Tat pathway signal sequence domain protein n=1 Tax=Inquilinus sp. OTU3971 TaxID=3043855 RepID=UPI00313C94ED
MTSRRQSVSALSALLLALSAAPALAEAAAPAATPNGVSLELNTLEPRGQNCAVNMVFGTSDDAYQSFKLDLVFFGTDGAIRKRLAVDAAPLRARKTSVKAFEVSGLACDAIGSVLVNDVLDCRTEAGAVADCIDRVETRSRLPVALMR